MTDDSNRVKFDMPFVDEDANVSNTNSNSRRGTEFAPRRPTATISATMTNSPTTPGTPLLRHKSSAMMMRRQSGVMSGRRASVRSDATHGTAVEATQLHPTSLPNEFLALIRQFRARIETATCGAPSVEAGAINQLHHSCNDIVRYITQFLIQKHEEVSEYERRKLLGWAGETDQHRSAIKSAPQQQEQQQEHQRQVRQPSPASGAPAVVAMPLLQPSVIGPFILSSLYAIMESLLHILRCDRGSIFLPDGTHLKAVVMVGGGAVAPPIVVERTFGVAGAVFRSGVAMNVIDCDRAPPQIFSRKVDNATGYHTRSILCFPLIVPQDGPASHDDDALKPGTGGQRNSTSHVRVMNQEVLGVVEFLNKSRNSVFTSFTEQDEIALQYYARLITSLIRWGGVADFASNTSQEESARLQRLILEQKHFATHNRTRTRAGAKSLTRTEAKLMHERQSRREDTLRANDNEQFVLHDSALLNEAHRVALEEPQTVVFRVGKHSSLPQQQQQDQLGRPSKKESSKSLFHTSSSADFMAQEVGETIARGGNVHDLVVLLEQTNASWRHCCSDIAALHDRIRDVENRLATVQRERNQLEKLCTTCGILLPAGVEKAKFSHSSFDAVSENESTMLLEEVDNALSRTATRQMTVNSVFQAEANLSNFTPRTSVVVDNNNVDESQQSHASPQRIRQIMSVLSSPRRTTTGSRAAQGDAAISKSELQQLLARQRREVLAFALGDSKKKP